MSIRYKIFGAFSVVIALACGLAFYGIRGISTSGDLVVRLYDGPLMGINHARSAHAALNEARLLMQQGLQRGRVGRNGREARKAARRHFRRPEGRSGAGAEPGCHGQALERAESRLRDWSEAGLKILKPRPAG